ncbi:hypothetical protein BJY00DRAFT_293557 [Aspergillus carlsbadensis]|nr:hypothetical protein BJY00DRAFT_293557 [Aspergillus carlsbadensis]
MKPATAMGSKTCPRPAYTRTRHALFLHEMPGWNLLPSELAHELTFRLSLVLKGTRR